MVALRIRWGALILDRSLVFILLQLQKRAWTHLFNAIPPLLACRCTSQVALFRLISHILDHDG